MPLALRHALRHLLRAPGFTVLAAGTLALGIAASTAIFSLADAVVLAPLPYDDPAGRVMIWNRWRGFDKTWVNPAEMRAYAERCPSLAAVAYWGNDRANLTGDGEAARVGVARISANGFAVLGARPLARPRLRSGGGPAGGPARGGARPRAVAGPLRRRPPRARAAGSSSTACRTRWWVSCRAGFALPTDFTEDAAEPTQIYVPRAPDADELTQFGNHGDYGAAQLAPGASPARATEELRAATRQLTAEGRYETRANHNAFAVSLPDEILGPQRPAVAVVAAAAILLLLIACANVASLLLARGAGRQRELALRAAVGGGRGRLIGQQLVEGLLLALVGALVGLPLAAATLRLLGAVVTANVPRAGAASIDPRAVAFALGLAVATTLVFALVPALSALKLDLAGALARGRSALGRGRLAPALAARRGGRAGGVRRAAGRGRRSDGEEPRRPLAHRPRLRAERRPDAAALAARECLPGGGGRDPLLPRAARRDARAARREERRPAALAAARRVDRRLGHRRRGLRRAGARLGPGRLAGGLRGRRRNARGAARQRTAAEPRRRRERHSTWP